MAKNSITDYSKTAASNTDIQSVDIAEGCLPSGINNAIREIMADLADMNDGTVTLTSPAFAAASLTGNLSFGDNAKAIFGAGSDLQIYHSGAGSFISDVGNGALHIRGTNLILQNGDGTKRFLDGNDGGAVEIHYADATNGVKLATTSTGIDVTGTVTADGLTVDTNTLHVDSTNNRVGLGTVLPSAQLHISGDDTTNQVIIENTSASADSAPDLVLQRNSDSPADNDTVGQIVFTGRNDNSQFPTLAHIRTIYTDVTDGTEDAALTFRTMGGGTNSERMRIDSSGNVGIGTTSPAEKLAVNGNIDFPSTSSTIGYDGSSGSTTRIAQIEFYNNSDGSMRLSTNNSSTGGINFYTQGSERMRVDRNGRVGIGTSSPETQLMVEQSGTFNGVHNTAGLKIRNAAATTGIGNPYGAITLSKGTGSSAIAAIGQSASDADVTGLAFYVHPSTTGTAAASEAMRIDSSGNVGIGTSSPSATLDVVSSSQVRQQYTGASNGFQIGQFNSSGDASINNQANANLLLATNNTERMRVTAGGTFLINTTSGISAGSHGWAFSKFSGATRYGAGAASSNVLTFYTTSGVAGKISISGTSTSYQTSSDYRLKENISDITDGITRVKQLQPKRFNFIHDADTTVDGFLAHEAQTVVPEAISGKHNETEAIGDITDADSNTVETGVVEPDTLEDGHTWTETGTQPVYQGIDQSKLVPLLTAALQEAITKIEDLEARVATLEGN